MDPSTKAPLFSPLALALARHVVGPWVHPVPGSLISLEGLQELKWRHIATESERADALLLAVTIVAGPLAGLLRPGAEHLLPVDAAPLASTGLPDQPGAEAPRTAGACSCGEA